MKKTLLNTTIMLVATAMVALFSGPASATVSGVCSNCHTMHASQDGASMLFAQDVDGNPNGALVRGGCVGCHAQAPAGASNIRHDCSRPSSVTCSWMAIARVVWQSGSSATSVPQSKCAARLDARVRSTTRASWTSTAVPSRRMGWSERCITNSSIPVA